MNPNKIIVLALVATAGIASLGRPVRAASQAPRALSITNVEKGHFGGYTFHLSNGWRVYTTSDRAVTIARDGGPSFKTFVPSISSPLRDVDIPCNSQNSGTGRVASEIGLSKDVYISINAAHANTAVGLECDLVDVMIRDHTASPDRGIVWHIYVHDDGSVIYPRFQETGALTPGVDIPTQAQAQHALGGQ